MDNNNICENCPHISSLNERVTKLENSMNVVEKDISDIKVNQAASNEKITNIFKALDDIKRSIDKIGDKLDKQLENIEQRFKAIEMKPSQAYEKIKMAIISAVCSGAVGIFLGYIFTK